MTNIKAVIGGKQKGIADQVSIDPALGCKYQCVGCYARKSCQRGNNYDNVVYKNLDEEVLKKSIRYVKSKGFRLARVGKHCDPGDRINCLNGILNCCNDESFRCIVVSKSLDFNAETAELLKTGNHTLHISLGPESKIAKNEESRVTTAQNYRDTGVRTIIRLTRDITKEISEFDKNVSSNFECIVTPMRYPSKEIMSYYNSNPRYFVFSSGYYRPTVTNDTWKNHMSHICGEINNEVKCCNCLVSIV